MSTPDRPNIEIVRKGASNETDRLCDWIDHLESENAKLNEQVLKLQSELAKAQSEVAHLKTSLAEHMSLTAQALKELKSALAPTQRPRRT